MGLSAHQSAHMKNDEWLTPPMIKLPLGRFDLDPCSPIDRPWDTADQHYTIEDDGLSKAWHGRVWLNPPFGREAIKWMRRMCDHGNGIALIPARTETAMFYETVWGHADGVLFLRKRPHFHVSQDTTFIHNGKPVHVARGCPAPFNSGAPIVLVAYGERNLKVLIDSCLGFVVVQHDTRSGRDG